MYDSRALKVYGDGSALRNPGSGGFALVIQYPDDPERPDKELKEGYFVTTNNRMELLACIRAMQYIQGNLRDHGAVRAIIITDSLYVYENQKRAAQWKKDKWKNFKGRYIENEDLWALFLLERSKLRIPTDIVWEAGKTRPVLKRVDQLAKDSARHPTKNDNGYQIGKITASKAGHKKGATLFSAKGQEICIRIYRRNYKGKLKEGEQKITFTVLGKEALLEKYFAYTTIGSDIHRDSSYKVKFNDNPDHPLIESFEEIGTGTEESSIPVDSAA